MAYEDTSLKPSKYAVFRWLSLDQFVPERSVTSYWVSSKTLFIIRVVLALYSTIVLWADIGTHGKSFFQFFTSFTFVGLHAYLITTVVNHFRYLYTKDISFMINQCAALTYLYVYLYSTVVTLNIVTPVVYWSLLAVPQTNSLSAWLNSSVHGVSFFLMLIDVIFNRIKLPIRTVLFPLITMICYMILAFIIYGVDHYWVYPFLDWSQGAKAALWYIIVAVVAVVAFFIQLLIHWIRDRIAVKLGKETSASVEAEVNEEKTEDEEQKIETSSINNV